MAVNTTGLDADLLKAVRAACFTCWKARHGPPSATALILMSDYKWQLSYQLRAEEQVIRMAWDAGWDGSQNDLLYLAHREAYAAGDETELEAMLRHVRLGG